jgi:hypothetical protein
MLCFNCGVDVAALHGLAVQDECGVSLGWTLTLETTGDELEDRRRIRMEMGRHLTGLDGMSVKRKR